MMTCFTAPGYEPFALTRETGNVSGACRRMRNQTPKDSLLGWRSRCPSRTEGTSSKGPSR
jgi:hypothetical protein